MKKIALLSLILLASVALTGCLFQKTATPAAIPAPTSETPVKESFSGTMQELLAKGKSVKCTSVSENDSGKTEGEFYIDGASGRTKSVTKITVAGQTQVMNSIMTKEAVYTWTEGQKQGFLFPVSKTEPTPTTAEPTTAEPTAPATGQPDEKYNMNCEVWKVDDSLFTVPTDVTFVDQATKLKELMKNIPVK